MAGEIHVFDVIRRPVITEKSGILEEDLNVYTFEVDMRASKAMVKEAVENDEVNKDRYKNYAAIYHSLPE